LIAIDTNVLVYAHRAEFGQHRPAMKAVTELAEGAVAWALPVFVLTEFLRVVTHPRLLDPPSPLAVAVETLEALLGSPSVRVLRPERRFWSILTGCVTDARARGNLIYDAQIAAVCLEHGAETILTSDRDFRRFEGITVKPLQTGSD